MFTTPKEIPLKNSKTPKVILLNGCSSSGKTTLCQEIQKLSGETWIHVSCDNFWDMLPSDKNKISDYIHESKSYNEKGPVVKLSLTQKGVEYFKCLPKLIKNLAEIGCNVIVDDCLVDANGLDYMNCYLKELNKYNLCFVGVFCDFDVLIQREIARGDRTIGLVNGNFDIIHKNLIKKYHLTVDTTNASPSELAQQILNFFNTEKQN